MTTTLTYTSPAGGAARAATPTMSIRTMVSSLLLFLVLLIIHHDAFVAVDAFATISRTRTRAFTSGRTILWSGPGSDNIVKSESSSTESSSEEAATSKPSSVNGDADIDSMIKEATQDKDRDESEVEILMKKINESGVAGVISYAAWELAFWTVSVPVCVLGYKEVTGHWPDINNKDDISKLGAEAFAFVNFARFAVPLRIGLALGTTPWIQENIVDVYLVDDTNDNNKESTEEEKNDKIAVEENEDDSVDNTISTADADADADETSVVQSKKNIVDVSLVDESNDNKKESSEEEKKNDAIVVEESEDDSVANTMTTADADATSVVQSTKDDDGFEEGKEANKPNGRFRIRTRLGNLMNRVLRRNNRSQQQEKE